MIIVKDLLDRWPGRAGPDQDGVMHGDNLQRVVEVKFPDDSLGEEQRNAYIDIAGSINRFSVCDVNDCDGEREKRTSGNGSRVPNPVLLPPPLSRNDPGAGGAPVPAAPEPKPKPGLAPAPSPNGAYRVPAPIYSPVPTQEPAWYEHLGTEAAELTDAIARAFSQLSAELRAKLSEVMPWIAQNGKWVKEQAHEAWVWVNDKGERVARWSKEQLTAAWEDIARETDLRWEQIKSTKWGQILVYAENVVAVVLLVVAVTVAAYVAVLSMPTLAGLIAILGITALMTNEPSAGAPLTM